MIRMILLYHMIAYATAFAADMIIGDPDWMWNPASLIKNIIAMVESRWNDGRDTLSTRITGFLFVVNILVSVELVVVGILIFFYLRLPFLAISVEALLTYFLFSTKALKDETNKVYFDLASINPKWAKGKKERQLSAARERLQLLSGKDTKDMSYEKLISLAVDTAKKSAKDKCIAPIVYAAFSGPVGGYFYKTIDIAYDAVAGDEEGNAFADTTVVLHKLLSLIGRGAFFVTAGLSCIFLDNRVKDIAADTPEEYELEDIQRVQNLIVMSAVITFIIAMLIIAGVVCILYLG